MDSVGFLHASLCRTMLITQSLFVSVIPKRLWHGFGPLSINSNSKFGSRSIPNFHIVSFLFSTVQNKSSKEPEDRGPGGLGSWGNHCSEKNLGFFPSRVGSPLQVLVYTLDQIQTTEKKLWFKKRTRNISFRVLWVHNKIVWKVVLTYSLLCTHTGSPIINSITHVTTNDHV